MYDFGCFSSIFASEDYSVIHFFSELNFSAIFYFSEVSAGKTMFSLNAILF
jgi:hypothetical protein